MSTATTIVLHDEMHFLDSFRPDNGIVLPEGGHFHVLLVHAFFTVDHGAGAAVAILLTLVRDIAQRPGGWLAARRLLDDLRADVDGTVAVIHRMRPVLGTFGVEHLPAHVVVR